MTYHAELAPRRRPWLIAMPLILVLLLGAVWTGVWFYAAREAETRMDAWRAQQARGGTRVRLRQPDGRRLSVPHRGALHERFGGAARRAAAARHQAEGGAGGRPGVGSEAPDRGVHRAARGVRPGPATLCARHLDAGAGERARNAVRAGARVHRGRRAEARGRDGRHDAVRLQAHRVACARAVRLLAAQSRDRSCDKARGARVRRRSTSSPRSRSMPIFWRCCTA